MTTGIRDQDLIILSNLDDADLLNFCQTSKYGKKLCENEDFWRNRTWDKYGRVEKDSNKTWKNYYLKLAHYLDKYTINKAFEELAKNGDIYLIQGLINKVNRMGLLNALQQSSKFGHFELFKYLFSVVKKKGFFVPFDLHWALLYALENNHVKIAGTIVNYFEANNLRYNKRTALEYAARGGNRDTIDKIIIMGQATDWDSGMAGAAFNGNLDSVNYFIKYGADNWNVGLTNAAEGGHEALIDFFISKGSNDWNSALIGAAAGGHLGLVKRFLTLADSLGNDEFSSILDEAVGQAIYNNHVDVTKILLEKGAEPYEALINAVYDERNYDFIKYMLDKKSYDLEPVINAARGEGIKSIIQLVESRM